MKPETATLALAAAISGLEKATGRPGVKGEKGDKGDRGEKGEKGDSIVGPRGTRGMTGDRGDTGLNGLPGGDGIDGRNGKDGKQGPKGDKGEKGKDGLFTIGQPGKGVPIGGSAGQVLAKITNTSFETQWVDQTGGAGGGTWGSITGTLSDQLDLQSALDAKISNITGLITHGTNVTITGTGTTIDPYVINASDAAIGDVVGPASAVANNVVFFNGTTGKLIKDSGLTLSGSNTGDQVSIVGITGTLAEFNAALTGADFATGGGTATNTNTGDQTSIVGITGTKAQFDTACADGNFLYSGDVTQYTDEMAQDAVGAMVDATLVYVDATPLLTRGAISGDITIAQASNTAAITAGVIIDADVNASAGVAFSKMAILAINRALVSSVSGVVSVATTTAAEIGFVNGVTSAIQTQIDGKQAADADLTSWAAITRAAGFDTFAATPSSANLLALVTNETGTGALAFATSPTLVTPILGTPTSGTLTNATGLPIAGLVASTSTAIGVGSVELGHASDTTLARASAGQVTIEGNVIYRAGGTDVPVTDGGTGSSTAAGARTNLGVDVLSITFVIDGGGSAITTGVKGDLTIPFACTIQEATLLADQSGSIVVNIWKDTYANYPPVVGDKITASAPPTISTATKSQDATLPGWTTSIAAGDTLRFNVDSITTITRVTLSLKVVRA